MIQLARDETRESTVYAAPTGSGKTIMFLAMVKWCVENRKPIAIYCVRRLLLQQLMRELDKAGIYYGVVAATQRGKANPNALVQLCMLPTVASAVRNGKGVPFAEVVIVDEAHQQREKTARAIFGSYVQAGAKLMGFTATPIEIDHIYDTCEVIVKNSQLRRPAMSPPALLEARTYAAPEIDAEGLKLNAAGEFSYKDLKDKYTPKLFGHVIEHYLRLNPHRQPCMLFAPGVAESIWFAEEFSRYGIPAAHIDGEDVWIDGQLSTGSPELRASVLDKIKTGEVKVVCNRFVLREGIDIPELKHLVLATPIGSLSSYVQVVGRVLRYHPSVDPDVVIQDHGGNWYRHGSPNADRDWADWFHLPERVISQMRTDAMRDKQETQPISCPNCSGIRSSGPVCPHCGYRCEKGRRVVLQSNGALKQVDGNPIKPRYTKSPKGIEKLWESYYHRARRAGITFSAARGLFVKENHYWPAASDGSPRLPFMPKNYIDWYMPVNRVPVGRLY